MTVSAVLLAVFGALLLFAPEDVSGFVAPEASGLALMQLLGAAFLGFGLALALYIPLFLLRAMGGGDVRLMAAVGALAGPRDWFVIFVLASLAGGVFAFGLIFVRNSLGITFRNIGHILKNLARFRAPYASEPDLDISSPKAITMPHGVAIAAGTMAFLFLR